MYERHRKRQSGGNERMKGEQRDKAFNHLSFSALAVCSCPLWHVETQSLAWSPLPPRLKKILISYFAKWGHLCWNVTCNSDFWSYSIFYWICLVVVKPCCFTAVMQHLSFCFPFSLLHFFWALSLFFLPRRLHTLGSIHKCWCTLRTFPTQHPDCLPLLTAMELPLSVWGPTELFWHCTLVLLKRRAVTRWLAPCTLTTHS